MRRNPRFTFARPLRVSQHGWRFRGRSREVGATSKTEHADPVARSVDAAGLGDTTTDRTIKLPENRVIRKRVAARTTAIHICALADESWSVPIMVKANQGGYVQKRHFPMELHVQDLAGGKRVISRDEAWGRADKKGAALELVLLSGLAGRIAAFFSTHGQGIYANYGRPTVDFSGFFRDHVAASAGAKSAGTASHGGVLRNAPLASKALQLGPLFIAADTASAAGLSALGHLARGAGLTNAVVASDIFSTGAYEGTSAWATAKLGVFTGAKAMALAAALPLPGVGLATLAAGLAVGAATTIGAKQASNRLKDKAVDAAYEAALRPCGDDQAPGSGGRRRYHPAGGPAFVDSCMRAPLDR